MRRTACLVLAVLLVIASGCAEETRTAKHYPVAYVAVREGSSLNVRRSPAGEWAYMGLHGWEDVIILQQQDGWALVNTPDRVQDGKGPVGWVCMDYLHTYRDYIMLEDSQ